jgi:hypothetical protein
MRLAAPVGLIVLLLPAHSTQAAPVTVRPGQASAVENVANTANALDDNPGTFASLSVNRVCRQDHDTPRKDAVTFDRFPAGYRAQRVEVTWTVSATFAVMQQNEARVTAKVEYNVGAGWRPVEKQTWTTSSKSCPAVSDGSLPCLDHSVAASLPPGHDAGRLRVRVTLEGVFSKCAAAGPSGVANLTSHAKIYDVRLIADKPAARPRATGR